MWNTFSGRATPCSRCHASAISTIWWLWNDDNYDDDGGDDDNDSSQIPSSTNFKGFTCKWWPLGKYRQISNVPKVYSSCWITVVTAQRKRRSSAERITKSSTIVWKYIQWLHVANNVGYHVPVDHLSLDVPLHHQLIAVCRHTDHCRDIGVVWQEHIVSTVSKVWKEILNIRREIFLWSFLRDFCNIPQLGFPRKQLLHLLASVSAFLRQFCPVLTLKRVFWVRREVSTGNCGFYRVHYSISCRSALRPRLYLYYWSTCSLKFSGLFTDA